MHMKLEFPTYTKKILSALNEAGYEAYLVGGAVRDLLLEREPGDYDITTSALPEQTMAVARSRGWTVIDNLGQNFGCVVVVIDGEPTEITTFRGEKYGTDAHKPSEIWFARTLQEDMSRRDFTINAMALDAEGRLYDYFGGQKDLGQRILRTVGRAEQRYTEDGLRMLRACRFVAQLGFTYVDDAAGFKQLGYGMEGTPYYLTNIPSFPVERCRGLSVERVRKELDKLLMAPQAGKGCMLLMATGLAKAKCRVKENGHYLELDILPELEHLVGLHQNPKYHCYDTWEHTLLAIDNSPQVLEIRWAMLLHDVGKGLPGIRTLNKEGQPSDHGHEAESARLAEIILTRLRYPAAFVKRVVWLVAQHMRFAPMLVTGEKTLLRWVRTEAHNGYFRKQSQLVEAYSQLVEVFLADMGATWAKDDPQLMEKGRQLGEQVLELCKTRMPISTSDLKIGGRELLPLIGQENIKAMLTYLLHRVQNGDLQNNEPALWQAAKKNIARRGRNNE